MVLVVIILHYFSNGSQSIKRVDIYFNNEAVLNFAKLINLNSIPVNIYLFKVNNKNTRKRCEMCLKFTIKTPEQRQ